MDKITPKISIIFPSYNGERFLKRNLNSIKKLSYLNEIEIIIVDNNSTDSSIEIIKSYKKEINIKLIEQKVNLGFAKACNIGTLYAKGEFVFFTNQDVIYPSNFFQKLIKDYYDYRFDQEIILSPAVIFEGNGIHYFGAKIHFLGFSYTPDVLKKLPNQKIVKTTQRITGCTFFLKKELFLEIGGFDNIFFMYCEDTDISLRILRKGLKIYTTNVPYLIHQKHEWIFSDFQYYLLERNRFIAFFKNIDNFKRLIPFFLIMELILLFQAIFIKKFKLRIRIYYEILTRIKFFKNLRENSKKESDLMPYHKLSKTLDPVLLGNLKNIEFFNKILRLFNILLKIV